MKYYQIQMEKKNAINPPNLTVKSVSRQKLRFKIKHLFERDIFEDDDYVTTLYDLMQFISDIMERDINKEKFIKEF